MVIESESSYNNHDNVDRHDDGEERNGQQQQKKILGDPCLAIIQLYEKNAKVRVTC